MLELGGFHVNFSFLRHENQQLRHPLIPNPSLLGEKEVLFLYMCGSRFLKSDCLVRQQTRASGFQALKSFHEPRAIP
jgi:hypothetical protein